MAYDTIMGHNKETTLEEGVMTEQLQNTNSPTTNREKLIHLQEKNPDLSCIGEKVVEEQKTPLAPVSCY